MKTRQDPNEFMMQYERTLKKVSIYFKCEELVKKVMITAIYSTYEY